MLSWRVVCRLLQRRWTSISGGRASRGSRCEVCGVRTGKTRRRLRSGRSNWLASVCYGKNKGQPISKAEAGTSRMFAGAVSWREAVPMVLQDRASTSMKHADEKREKKKRGTRAKPASLGSSCRTGQGDRQTLVPCIPRWITAMARLSCRVNPVGFVRSWRRGRVLALGLEAGASWIRSAPAPNPPP